MDETATKAKKQKKQFDTDIDMETVEKMYSAVERVMDLGTVFDTPWGPRVLGRHPSVMSMNLALACRGKGKAGIKRATAGTKKSDYSLEAVARLKSKTIQACADIVRKPGGLKYIFPLRDDSRHDKINIGRAEDIVAARSRELQFASANTAFEAANIDMHDMAAENTPIDFKLYCPRIPMLPLNIKNVGMLYRNAAKNHGIHPPEEAVPLAWPKLIGSFGGKPGESWQDVMTRHGGAEHAPVMLWVYAIRHELSEDMARFLRTGLDEAHSLLVKWGFDYVHKYYKNIENLVAYSVAEHYAEQIQPLLGPPAFFAISNWRIDRLLQEERIWYNRQTRAVPNAERSDNGGDNNLLLHRTKEMTPWEAVRSALIADPEGTFRRIQAGEI